MGATLAHAPSRRDGVGALARERQAHEVTTRVSRGSRPSVRDSRHAPGPFACLVSSMEGVRVRRFACRMASFCLLPLAVATPARAQSASSPATAEAASTITASDLRGRVGVLAHDSMGGRDTPSPGLERTALYVASEFRRFGLRPAVDDSSYLQRYPLTLMRPGAATDQSLVLRGPDAEWRLDPTSEFVAVPVADQARGEGELVLVEPDDEAADVRGKLVVFRLSPRQLQGLFGRARELLTERGASGALLVVSAPPAYVDGLRAFFGSERVSLGEPGEFPAPIAIVPESELPGALGTAVRTGSLAGWWARLHSEAEVRRAEAWNAVGWIEGSDPVLRYEYVVFTAHMDHVGVGRPVDGDSIYNGADDNASGTSTIVELAEAFARTEPRPKRSLVFMTVSGEEKGLWGSRWYAENPLFPLGRTVADLNIDMIGRNWDDTVVAIGKAESSLGTTLEEVAAAHAELGLTVIDDPWPEERFYFRSDHYNFARAGVPILFFFTGVHEDYHRPSDEPAKLKYDKMARIGRLIYHLGRRVADEDERPEWDPEAYRRIVETGSR